MCGLSPEVEESVLCILSRLQQFRIMNAPAAMLLRSSIIYSGNSASFDLANLCTHTVIIISVRMTGREATARWKGR